MTTATPGTAVPPTLRIGIFVFEGFEPIDVFGFAEAFTIARFLGQDYADPPPYPFAVTLIARHCDSVRSINGPAVLPDRDMAQARVLAGSQSGARAGIPAGSARDLGR